MAGGFRFVPPPPIRHANKTIKALRAAGRGVCKEVIETGVSAGSEVDQDRKWQGWVVNTVDYLEGRGGKEWDAGVRPDQQRSADTGRRSHSGGEPTAAGGLVQVTSPLGDVPFCR
ncbi:hypothetical protein Ga0074812_107332 [Parafrankia irregularis]|uniref:Uncharacterized protein n=1 Tax=Parafrankia irregularis TaxID=795642 RepID=A0A0S4QLJ5_9ACTN|nr:hypothetical protein Ga0074812_107332 [Parafrankia irregularis]